MKLKLFLLLVLTLIGVVMFPAWYQVVFGGRDIGLQARCEADIVNIRTLLERKIKEGRVERAQITASPLPIADSLPEIAQIANDPWGHAYRVQRIDGVDGVRLRIFSLGPDGVQGEDDIAQSFNVP